MPRAATKPRTTPAAPVPVARTEPAPKQSSWGVIPHEERTALFQRAIAEGRYVPGKNPQFCTRCRTIQEGTYGGRDGERWCKKCTEEVNAGTGATPLPVARFAREVRQRYVPKLEDVLLLWAHKNLPRAFEAFAERDDGVWEGKVLASIVRARAAAEPGWVVRLAQSRYGAELLRIGQYVVRAGGYPLPGTFGSFDEWVEAVMECPV